MAIPYAYTREAKTQSKNCPKNRKFRLLGIVSPILICISYHKTPRLSRKNRTHFFIRRAFSPPKSHICLKKEFLKLQFFPRLKNYIIWQLHKSKFDLPRKSVKIPRFPCFLCNFYRCFSHRKRKILKLSIIFTHADFLNRRKFIQKNDCDIVQHKQKYARFFYTSSPLKNAVFLFFSRSPRPFKQRIGKKSPRPRRPCALFGGDCEIQGPAPTIFYFKNPLMISASASFSVSPSVISLMSCSPAILPIAAS